MYIIIYTNLELKTKYLFIKINKKKNLRDCAGRDLVILKCAE